MIPSNAYWEQQKIALLQIQQGCCYVELKGYEQTVHGGCCCFWAIFYIPTYSSTAVETDEKII